MSDTFPLPEKEVLWEEAQDLAEDIAAAKGDKTKVAAAIADFLDVLIPLDVLLPGIGILLEAHDDDAFEKVVLAIVNLLSVDPEKRAERKAKRDEKKKERRRRREMRRAARRGGSDA